MRIVIIDGPARSGKTTFANYLNRAALANGLDTLLIEDCLPANFDPIATLPNDLLIFVSSHVTQEQIDTFPGRDNTTLIHVFRDGNYFQPATTLTGVATHFLLNVGRIETLRDEAFKFVEQFITLARLS